MSSQASPSIPGESAAGEALQTYCSQFAARRSDQLTALFSPHAVVEIPLLPHHVRGAEVAPALEGIVSTIKTCDVDLRHVAACGQTAIGEGHLRAQTEDGPLSFDFALVVEVDDSGQIMRLSEYFDTDPIKPLD
jgi:ketosteroid isomerase-like protein